jgi:hypothetical protein
MSVDSFDAGKLPADLVARLSEHEAAMAISPALAAKLAEFEAQQAQDALRDLRTWRRDLDRSEELDFLVRERAAERRQRAAAGHAGNAAPAVRPDRMQPPAALAAVVALRPTAAPAAEAPAPAIAALGPPAGFVKGGGWTPETRAALLQQDDDLKRDGLSNEGALIELHKAWGYSKRQDRNGGPLAKVLTKARAERKASRQRSSRAG